MNEPNIQDQQRAEISRILSEKGWSGAELARAADVAPSTINRFLNDPAVKHALSARTMEKIRRAGKTTSNLSANNSIDATLSQEVKVYIHGEVQAGEPMNISDHPQDSADFVTLAKDDRFPGIPKFALRVKGDSMDEIAPHGSTVFCVKYIDLGRDPEPGELVVIQHRHANGLTDATLKQYVERDGTGYLVPRSTNPAHQAPIQIPDNGEDDSTLIWARVFKVQRDY